MTAEKDLFEVDDLQPGRSFLNFSGAGPAKGGLEGIKPFAKDRPRSPPAHGTAKVTYPNGDIYEGSYEGGLRHGKGIIKFADGRQYRGKWRLDMPHGQGEEIRADRTTYKGEYYQGLWQGYGVETSVYGDEYHGEWRQGERHGKGEYFNDGLHYDGEWLSGRRAGMGKCTFRNGDLYEGEFQADLMHGEGVMILANGCRYAGSWVKGKMEGKGQMLLPSGDVYDGEWMAGKKHGAGIYTAASGSVYEGQFENGKRHGKGVQRSAVAPASHYKTTIIPYKILQGEVYDGEWKFGKRCGMGTIAVKNQKVYEGEFVNDKRDGIGTGYLKNGSTYTGAWKMGKMHGKGQLSSGGQTVQGIWEEGVCKQTIGSDFETLKQLEMGAEGGDMMEAFEKGRNRLLNESVIEGGHDATLAERKAQGMDGTPGYLHDIEEGIEEDEAARSFFMSTSPTTSGAVMSPSGSRGSRAGSSRGESARGDRLPDIQSAGAQRTANSAAAVHDEQSHLTGQYGVPMRGTFDVHGRYIPPVSTDTLREWNLVNSSFVNRKDQRTNMNRKQASGLAAAESVYTFERRVRPGYGEGSSIKEAKSHVPRKTHSLEAGPGEFSFKRWRMERHL